MKKAAEMVQHRMYFHRSEKQLELGLILVPQGNMHLFDQFESILEARRPKHCRSRQKTVFLTCHPWEKENGTVGDYLYRVLPRNPIEGYFSSWFTDCQKAYLKHLYGHENGSVLAHYPDLTTELMNECADKYWSGKEKPISGRSQTTERQGLEFIVPEAEVIEDVSGFSDEELRAYAQMT